MSDEEIRRLTYALRHPDTAAAAVEALRGAPGRAVTEGLVELLHEPPGARAAVAAIAALEGREEPIVLDALHAALGSPHRLVRIAAIEAWHRRGAFDADIARQLRCDESWLVRRAAVRALADAPEPLRDQALAAATDPHWRVRHALIQALLCWGVTESQRQDIAARLAGDDARTDGVWQYLHYRWSGRLPAGSPPPVPVPSWPFWDDDPAVLARNLDRLGDAGRQAALDAMPALLGHDDERVRARAAEALKRRGEPRHLVQALQLLDEPRTEAVLSLRKLLAALDVDREEATARLVLEAADVTAGPLAWARDREQRDCAVVSMQAESQATLSADHPHCRAAALTAETAAELVRDPASETSWHVLAKAARLAKVPLWELEPPEPWQPPPVVARTPEPLSLDRPTRTDARVLGPARLLVTPLGISGHYGLPVEGFVRAAEAGVNLLFWEPNYHTLTAFASRLAAADRAALHLVAGTFEADGVRLRKDAERALRALRIERLAVFLVFWVRSWARISDDVRDELERLQNAGKIGCYGLSTHARPLAVEAIAAGWNPVMVRHSAAHRGAEAAIFPAALQTGTSLLTFNNTCYGRLPQAPHGPSVADCYRYTLGQPAVTACWSAPATLTQLDDNLAAMHEPTLSEERRRVLLEQGERVYREDAVFRALVRSR